MCGIMGVIGHKDASRLVYLGLYALQHRGEESAGIAAYDGRTLRSNKGMGLAGDVFDEKNIRALRGNLAVGHIRYSTTGASAVKNIQPFSVKHKKDHITIAHNGNLTNTVRLHMALEEKGTIFQTSMDSEIIVHLLAHTEGQDYKNRVIKAMSQIEGAYSCVLMLNGTLVGARDPWGWRPLCLGKVDGAYVLASETCALDLIQAEYLREVEPGEMVFINKDGLQSFKSPCRPHALCIFEYIYFARPDSNIFGKNVYLTRKALGRQLACECPAECDLVMPIPDSGNYAALGFAEQACVPYELGMIRNHYIGRTFIQPSQLIRDFRVRIKLNPIKELLKGKRVVIVEDSIVRGTTSRARVKTLRDAGAKEVHMRVSCPPLKFPCFYGIDFPTRKELIAARHSIEWIRDFIGVDSLRYLSREGMLEAMPLPKEEFCTACFDGNYPLKPCRKMSKHMLERS